MSDFYPPFCPNDKCKNHCESHDLGAFCVRKGFYLRRSSIAPSTKQRVQRFLCKGCSTSFGEHAFKLHYYSKLPPGVNSKIFKLLVCGLSNRRIAFVLGLAPSTIDMRILKLARWALMRHSDFLKQIEGYQEAIAIDGLENFAYSQYDPNNVHHAIGAESLFIYDFNFVAINRKGRMSERQKGILAEIENTQGRYNPKGIRSAFVSLVRALDKRRSNPSQELTLFIDKHFQYQRALQYDLKMKNLQVESISSKAHRDFRNILFSVNHTDLLLRHEVGAFKRETISFSKKPSRMLHKYMLYAVWKNYMRPCFTKAHKRRRNANVNTPAMELGLCSKILSFGEFFDQVRIKPEKNLSKEWLSYFKDDVLSKRDKKYLKKAA